MLLNPRLKINKASLGPTFQFYDYNGKFNGIDLKTAPGFEEQTNKVDASL